MKIVPYLLFLVSIIPAGAQEKLIIDGGCNFDFAQQTNTVFWVFEPDALGKEIVKDILNAVGLESNFILKTSADEHNARACVINKQRYIIYNIDFIRNFSENARNRTSIYIVFAHEIAHHLYGHNLSDTLSSENAKKMELAADRYSGSILNILGATLEESGLSMEFNMERYKETETHPSPDQRINALVEGWESHEQWKVKQRDDELPDPRDRLGDLEKCIFCPKMIKVERDSFIMGNEKGAKDEKPLHWVRLRAFYLSESEITIAQYRTFIEDMGYITDAERNNNNKYFQSTRGGHISALSKENWKITSAGSKNRSGKNDSLPVMLVSWNDALEYCKWLSKKTGRNFRLPTEAEWEYAAKYAGKGIEYTRFSGSNDFQQVGWIKENAQNQTHPVGLLKSNTLGFKDMTGNVREWCMDCYYHNYDAAPVNGDGEHWRRVTCKFRVIRGGGYKNKAEKVAVTYRGNATPSSRQKGLGFRVAMH